MIDYLIVFLCGAVCMRLIQFMLSITPNYYIFKHAEYTIFRILAELHVTKMTTMKIVEICYADLEKDAEYKNVETAVNKRYEEIISKYIGKLKETLPYKTNYNNLTEAMTQLLQEYRNGKQ